MSDILATIAKDLSITKYREESDSDFCYRVCYSSLALHLLYSARSIEHEIVGISKKAQTEKINRILADYETHLGLDGKRFIRDSNSYVSQCRKVYEETGYLTVDERGYDSIAQFGRTISVGCGHLYFGIPDEIAFSLGIGFYSNNPRNEEPLFDVILRDNLSSDEYIAGLYNPLDFEHRDIDPATLEFFNPTLKKSPHTSWENTIRTKRTVAKNKFTNTKYRVICEDDGSLLFADIDTISDTDSLISHETRRLLFALKEQYNVPAVAWINKIDEVYCQIRLSAHLPTREYYFLLLSSWPKEDAFDRRTFITTIRMLPTIETVLKNIGIEIIRRDKYV